MTDDTEFSEDGRIDASFATDELDPDDPLHVFESLQRGDQVKFRAEGADVIGFGTVVGHERAESDSGGILYVRVVADPSADRTTEFRLESRKAPRTGRWTDLEVRSMPHYPRTGERDMRAIGSHGRVTAIQRVGYGEVLGDPERREALEHTATVLEAAAKRAREGRPYSALETVDGVRMVLWELARADLEPDSGGGNS